MTTSGHNYDFGSLYVEPDGLWRMIAPTGSGPQPYATGGEMVEWTSADRGATWDRVRNLTKRSTRNHTYARRPVNAHPRFYSLWADGDGRERSESALYFAGRDGDVWSMPTKMEASSAAPERVR